MKVLSAFSPQSFNPIAMSWVEWRPVVRSPKQLRLHPALDELGWVGVVGELNEAAGLSSQSVSGQILITSDGIILTGIGRWRLAVFERRHAIPCNECLLPLDEDEALQFIISHHQPQRGWNAFIRIRLALKLEPYFQQRALDNMRAGGKYKGLAKLPEAQHIDVRQDIAKFTGSGAGARNVGKVRKILQTAHPRLIEALEDGTLTINLAIQFCRLSRAEQLEQFIHYSESRAIDKVIHQSIARLNKDRPSPNAASVLETLQQRDAQQPGSVAVRIGRQQRTVVVIGQDLKHEYCQTAFKPT